MIVVSEPTFPGLIEVKPVALFRMRDENAEDNKILCVPHTDPNWSHIERLDDLPMMPGTRSRTSSIYKTPEWKVVRVDGCSRTRSSRSSAPAEGTPRSTALSASPSSACGVGARLAHGPALALDGDLDLHGALRLAAQVDHGAAPCGPSRACRRRSPGGPAPAHADRELAAREARAGGGEESRRRSLPPRRSSAASGRPG